MAQRTSASNPEKTERAQTPSPDSAQQTKTPSPPAVSPADLPNAASSNNRPQYTKEAKRKATTLHYTTRTKNTTETQTPLTKKIYSPKLKKRNPITN